MPSVEEIVKFWTPFIRSVAKKQFYGDEYLVDECVQKTFIRLNSHYNRYGENGWPPRKKTVFKYIAQSSRDTHRTINTYESRFVPLDLERDGGGDEQN